MGSEQSHELHKNASDAAAKIEVCINNFSHANDAITPKFP